MGELDRASVLYYNIGFRRRLVTMSGQVEGRIFQIKSNNALLSFYLRFFLNISRF